MERDGPCMTLLSHDQTIALTFVGQAGIISATAVILFTCVVVKNYIRNIIHPPPGEWRLIRTHVDAYVISLLFADFLQSIGGMLTIKWAIEEKVYCSAFCTTQGILQHVGESGVALSTLAITLHTFATVFFHAQPPQWVWMVVVSAIWAFLAGYVMIFQLIASSPYTPTPFWCWINKSYESHRLFGEYLWVWIAAFSNVALYIPLYFCVRGNIDVHPVTRRITFNFRTYDKLRGFFGGRKRTKLGWDMINNGSNTGMFASTSTLYATFRGAGTTSTRAKHREALKLIWYPIGYTLVVLPISIARWSRLPDESHIPVKDIPITKTAITAFLFSLSGLVNVLVFLFTRPNILLFGPRRGLVTEPPRTGLNNTRSPPGFPTPNSVDSLSSGWPTARSPNFPISPYTPPSYCTSARSPALFPSSPSSPYFAQSLTPGGDCGPFFPTSSTQPTFSQAHDHGSYTVTGVHRRTSIAPRTPGESDIVLQDFPGTPAVLTRINLQRPPERARRKSIVRSSGTSSLRSGFVSSNGSLRGREDDTREVHFELEGPEVHRPRATASAPPSAGVVADELGSSWVTMRDGSRRMVVFAPPDESHPSAGTVGGRSRLQPSSFFV